MCSPLSVVQNDKGKQRLVIDLQYVNQYLPVQKFKYEGLNLVPSCLGRKISSLPLTLSLATIMLTFTDIVGLTLVFHGVRVILEDTVF